MSAARTAHAEPLMPIDKAAERPLWVVLIIMAFLAALALLSARIGERHYSSQQANLAGQATIQLNGLTPVNRLDVAQKALTIIKTTQPNIRAARMSDAQSRALIEPWMGSALPAQLPEGIALPILITLEDSTEAQRDSLRQDLSAAAISVIIDDHSQWSNDISRASRAFRVGSWLILALTVFSGTAASIFSTQSTIAAQSKTVAVFAQVGTPDSFIARLLMVRAVKVGLISSAIGTISALMFLALFRLLRGPSANSLFPSLTPSFSDVIMLIILCIVFAFVCAAAAGASAKQMLRQTRLYA